MSYCEKDGCWGKATVEVRTGAGWESVCYEHYNEAVRSGRMLEARMAEKARRTGRGR